EAILHEEVERQVEPLPFLANQRVGGQHAVLERDVVGDRGGADRADVLPREARRARLDDEARDAAAALLLVAAREDDPPPGAVDVGDEDLAPVQHPVVAALLLARLAGPGGVGAARPPGDRGERRPWRPDPRNG